MVDGNKHCMYCIAVLQEMGVSIWCPAGPTMYMYIRLFSFSCPNNGSVVVNPSNECLFFLLSKPTVDLERERERSFSWSERRKRCNALEMWTGVLH
jgi:hypothetical protein